MPKLWKDMTGEVKPEPVRETVKLFSHSVSLVWSSERDEFDTHRITFDLIDGKPDCDSIKMGEIVE